MIKLTYNFIFPRNIEEVTSWNSLAIVQSRCYSTVPKESVILIKVKQLSSIFYLSLINTFHFGLFTLAWTEIQVEIEMLWWKFRTCCRIQKGDYELKGVFLLALSTLLCSTESIKKSSSIWTIKSNILGTLLAALKSPLMGSIKWTLCEF